MPGLYKKHTATQLVMPEMRLEPLNVCLTDRRLNQLSYRDSLCMLVKVKSCYNPLRLGTVIVLVSSGIDFVNTPRLYSDRATR